MTTSSFAELVFRIGLFDLVLVALGELTTEGCGVFRLSIIIVAPESRDSNAIVALEETLVSVLENCPSHSETLLACSDSYEDPYELSDEVRFVRQASTSWTVLANAALQQARGRFVHVLQPGMTVDSGWQQDACDFLARCSDSIVGATPRIEYESGDSATVGISFSASGRRRYLDSAPDGPQPVTAKSMFGPCNQGGFFRRTRLIEAGGWNEAIHSDAADIELALRLRSLGFDFVHRPESILRGPNRQGGSMPASGYALTRDLERTYRTYQTLGVLPRRKIVAKLGRMFSGDSLLGRWIGGFGQLPMTESTVSPALRESQDAAADVDQRSRAA